MSTNENTCKHKYNRLEEVGEYTATLVNKHWGKRKSLCCYFDTDDGKSFYLYAWRVQSGERVNQYCPRDSSPNFRDVDVGTRWRITTKISKQGNVYWSTAEAL